MAEKQPVWINAIQPGKCACGADIAKGATARYSFADQKYVECEACAQSPRQEPMQPSAATVAALDAVQPVANESEAVADNSSLVRQLESFARRNARPGSDIDGIVDRMLASIMRAVL